MPRPSKKFIVKVQRPLFSTEPNPGWAIYDEHHLRVEDFDFQPSDRLRQAMTGAETLKGYFWARRARDPKSRKWVIDVLLDEPCDQDQDW